MHIKSLLKSTPLYPILIPLAGMLQDLSIRRDQARYEIRFREMTDRKSDNESPAEVLERVRQNLSRRGIVWPPKPAGRSLHILYVSVPGTWELHNIPPQLATIGNVSTYLLRDRGLPCQRNWIATRSAVDSDLPAFVEQLHLDKPVDMMLSYLSGAQVSPHTIQAIGAMGIPTFNFHLDDRLSFRGTSIGAVRSGAVDICAAFDLNLTSCPGSIVKYRVEGADAIFWPEGANPDHFKPLPLDFDFDVTFVGQRYGKRPRFIDRLRRAGIKVECFGYGWENGPLSETEMVQVYSRSRINLGFGYISRGSEQCLKGRDFEVPMCGALYLTSQNKDLELVYRIGTEIETYTDERDCVAKIGKLLADPERCACIRNAARASCLQRHTWAHRVKALLQCTGDWGSPLPGQ